MSYAVELAPDVVSQLQRLPSDLAERVLDQIEQLAHQPTHLSRPGSFPFQLFQVFEFECIANPITYRFTVVFQYSQDEQTLHLLNLGVLE
jgi:hypothetical protein